MGPQYCKKTKKMWTKARTEYESRRSAGESAPARQIPYIWQATQSAFVGLSQLMSATIQALLEKGFTAEPLFQPTGSATTAAHPQQPTESATTAQSPPHKAEYSKSPAMSKPGNGPDSDPDLDSLDDPEGENSD